MDECENDFVWMECHRGFIPSSEESFVCKDFNAEEDKVNCLPLPCFSPKNERMNSSIKKTEDCGLETSLILAGGTSVDEEIKNAISI